MIVVVVEFAEVAELVSTTTTTTTTTNTTKKWSFLCGSVMMSWARLLVMLLPLSAELTHTECRRLSQNLVSRVVCFELCSLFCDIIQLFWSVLFRILLIVSVGQYMWTQRKKLQNQKQQKKKLLDSLFVSARSVVCSVFWVFGILNLHSYSPSPSIITFYYYCCCYCSLLCFSRDWLIDSCVCCMWSAHSVWALLFLNK